MCCKTKDKKTIFYSTNNKSKWTHKTASNQLKRFCLLNVTSKVTKTMTCYEILISLKIWSYREFKVNRNHSENYGYKEEMLTSFSKSTNVKRPTERTQL